MLIRLKRGRSGGVGALPGRQVLTGDAVTIGVEAVGIEGWPALADEEGLRLRLRREVGAVAINERAATALSASAT